MRVVVIEAVLSVGVDGVGEGVEATEEPGKSESSECSAGYTRHSKPQP